jgi:putative ABC transport system permease protein
MEALLQDINYSFRSLLKRPSFATVSLLILMLSIGINTAIFSVINAVLLRPLPYKSPDRIVQLWENNLGKGIPSFAVTPRDYVNWVNEQSVFESLAAFRQQYFMITGVDEPERVLGATVSQSLFSTLGVDAAIGRGFTLEEDKPGNDRVVVMSFGLWQRRFGANPDLIDKTLIIDGNPYTVVGIMPADFQFPIQSVKAELWIPFAFRPAEIERGAHNTFVIARLKQGITLQQANADMRAIAAQLEQRYPDTNKGISLNVLLLNEQVVGNVRLSLLVLSGAVGFVLLIACANIANLVLARNTARQKEIAIRLALGASRTRILRQLLTESLLLSFLGGGLGLLLAFWATDTLVSISPVDMPRGNEARIDLQVFVFSMATSLLTGVVFGLIPSLQISKTDINKSLKEGADNIHGSYGRRYLRNVLVATEVALALTLLTGAGLMINSFIRLGRTEIGIDPKNLVTMEVSLPASKYRTLGQQVTFYQEVLERFRAIPGVQATCATSNLVLSGSAITETFTITDSPIDSSGPFEAGSYVLTPEYFRTMGTNLLSGRDFTDQDSDTAPKVIIINSMMAHRFWPGEEAIGKQISLGGKPPGKIVGIVGDTKRSNVDGETQPEFYIPYTQASSFRSGKLVIRSTSDPKTLAVALRGEIQAVDKDQAVYNLKTVEQMLSQSLAKRRYNMLLLSIFAGLSIILAAIGVYSVLAYLVAERTREIGIRMALGAQDREIIKLIVMQGMLPVLAGVVVGLGVALALTRILSSLLYGVTATDPASFLTVTLILIGVALAACYIPARAAVKVDPILTLRSE